jgi:hypothetical protein
MARTVSERSGVDSLRGAVPPRAGHTRPPRRLRLIPGSRRIGPSPWRSTPRLRPRSPRSSRVRSCGATLTRPTSRSLPSGRKGRIASSMPCGFGPGERRNRPRRASLADLRSIPPASAPGDLRHLATNRHRSETRSLSSRRSVIRTKKSAAVATGSSCRGDARRTRDDSGGPARSPSPRTGSWTRSDVPGERFSSTLKTPRRSTRVQGMRARSPDVSRALAPHTRSSPIRVEATAM